MTWEQRLETGAGRLGVSLPEGWVPQVARYRDELLRWNARVNLTAITSEAEVAEKHFLDSLAAWPEVKGARSLLDVGAGAGFPGIPLKLAEPGMEVTLVDAVAKKVGFLKHVLAQLGVKGARALHLRVEGDPESEGLPRCERVIARAFTDLDAWLGLAPAYLAEGGRVVAMLGRAPGREELDAVAARHGMCCLSDRRYVLPFSGDPRAVAVFGRA
ncbi:MAG: Ribosomal small subunit methyltransferase [Pseudomonadota bacterium]|jgi:16S rRNA (guanine527-N7)-methyltransferase